MKLSLAQQEELLTTLKSRFEKHMNRHKDLEWHQVQAKLEAETSKSGSLGSRNYSGQYANN